MSEPLHDIDKLFLENIGAHVENPPQKLWDKIEANLDKHSAENYRSKYYSIKRAAAILLFLFLGVISFEVITRYPGKGQVAGDMTKIGGSVRSAREEINDSISHRNGQNRISPELAGKNDDVSNKSVVLPGEKGLLEEKIREHSPMNDKRTANGRQNSGARLSDLPADKINNKTKHTILTEKKAVEFDVAQSQKQSSQKKEAIGDVPSNTLLPGSSDNNSLYASIKRDIALITPGLWNKDLKPVSITFPIVREPGFAKSLVQPNRKKATLFPQSNHRFAVSVYFSPQSVSNNLKDDQPYRPSGGGGGPVNHNEIRETEQNSFAYSAGLKLSFALGSKLSVQTGLNYTKSSTSLSSKDVYADRDNNGNIRYRVDCSSGYTYAPPHTGSNPLPGDRITMTDNRNTLAYLGVPLLVEYRMSFGKFSISPAAGGQLNFLLNGKTTAVLGKGTANETSVANGTEGLKSHYFSAITTIAAEFELNRRISLTLAPTGQFALSSINSGASVKTRPNYFGGAAGIKFRL